MDSFGFFLKFSNLYLLYASGTLEISMPIYEKYLGGDKKEKKNILNAIRVEYSKPSIC